MPPVVLHMESIISMDITGGITVTHADVFDLFYILITRAENPLQ